MRNQRGAILIITLLFILAFTMLGIVSLHYSGNQNIDERKRRFSAEAFWRADGAIEKAEQRLRQLPPLTTSITNPPVDLGGGDYWDMYSALVPGFTDKWKVQAKSEIGGQFRAIEAEVGSFGIDDAVQTHGTVNDGHNDDNDSDVCDGHGNAMIVGGCSEHVDFSFESVFNGASFFDFQAVAFADILVSSPSQVLTPPLFQDIVILSHDTNNQKITINSDSDFAGPTFLIVDTQGYTGNPTPSVQIEGTADFCGIIWIMGEAKLAGTSAITGAVFVDGDELEDTPITGDNNITFDQPCIDGALNNCPPGACSPIPSVNKWKEITEDELTAGF